MSYNDPCGIFRSEVVNIHLAIFFQCSLISGYGAKMICFFSANLSGNFANGLRADLFFFEVWILARISDMNRLRVTGKADLF